MAPAGTDQVSAAAVDSQAQGGPLRQGCTTTLGRLLHHSAD